MPLPEIGNSPTSLEKILAKSFRRKYNFPSAAQFFLPTHRFFISKPRKIQFPSSKFSSQTEFSKLNHLSSGMKIENPSMNEGNPHMPPAISKMKIQFPSQPHLSAKFSIFCFTVLNHENCKSIICGKYFILGKCEFNFYGRIIIFE